MDNIYIWECVRPYIGVLGNEIVCGCVVTWDGAGKKPVTVCSKCEKRDGMKIQMPLKQMPKK